MTHDQSPTLWVAAALLTITGLFLLDPVELIHGLANQGGAPITGNSPTPAPPPPGRPSPTPLTAQRAPSPSPSLRESDSSRAPSPTPRVESDGPEPGSGHDDDVQQALEQSTPRHLSGAPARAAATATWRQLKNDLTAGGWSELRREAVVVTPASPTAEPGEMTVTVLWSGTRAITGPTGRRRITAHAIPDRNNRWRIELLPCPGDLTARGPGGDLARILAPGLAHHISPAAGSRAVAANGIRAAARRTPTRMGNMADPGLLSDINRWAGVGIALFGSFVVAPSGSSLLWHSVTDWARKRGHQLHVRAARVLPFLRDPTQNVHLEAAGAVKPSGRLTLMPIRAPLDRTLSLEDQLAALDRDLSRAEDHLKLVTSNLVQETAARERGVAELEHTLDEKIRDLRRLLSEKDRESARIDARGLPLIGVGILLSGVPDELAALPGGLGWVFPVLGVVFTVAVGWILLREWRGTDPNG